MIHILAYKINHLLSDHPEIGILGSVGSFLLSLINNLTPVLQFIALIIGVAIGIVTLMIKWRDWRKGGK